MFQLFGYIGLYVRQQAHIVSVTCGLAFGHLAKLLRKQFNLWNVFISLSAANTTFISLFIQSFIPQTYIE